MTFAWPFTPEGDTGPLTREFRAILGLPVDEAQPAQPAKTKRPAWTGKPKKSWIDKTQRAADLKRLAEIKRRQKEGRKMKVPTAAAAASCSGGDCPNLPLLVHFDGACWPNPGGVLGWGVTIKRGKETLVELHDGRPASPSNTNNCAEYLALAAALEWLLEQGHAGARVHIRGDSRIVLRQMFPNGKGRTWRLKAGSYVEHARQAKALLGRFSAVTGEWIAREGNRRADALSQQGVREVAR